jgi:hypothetical protein
MFPELCGSRDEERNPDSAMTMFTVQESVAPNGRTHAGLAGA